MKPIALIGLVLALLAAAFFFMQWSGDPAPTPTGQGEQLAGDPSAAAELEGEGNTERPKSESETEERDERTTVDDRRIQIAGRLVDPRGQPLAGVQVQVFLGRAQAYYFSGSSKKATALDSTTTDGAGHFTLQATPGKKGYLKLADQKLVWTKRRPRYEKSDADLDLGTHTVATGGVLEGLVVDENERPIADAKLTLMAYETQQVSRSTKSAADGRFTIYGLPGGQAQITVAHDQYRTRHIPLVAELGKTRSNYKVSLRLGQALSGLVVDDRGQPVQGARVRVQGKHESQSDGSYESGGGSAKTDEHGAFRAAGLGAGPYSVSASAKGHTRASLKQIKEGTSGLQLQLSRLSTIAGRLVDETGKPIAGSRVRTTTKDPGESPKRDASSELSYVSVAVGAEVEDMMVYEASHSEEGIKTNENGEFQITDVKPGRNWIIATGAHQKATHGPLSIKPGSEVTGAEVTANRGGVAVVTVKDPSGQPLAGVRVQMSKPGKKQQRTSQTVAGGLFEVAGAGGTTLIQSTRSSAVQSARTDKEGRCELAGVKPGTYELRATHSKFVAPDPVTIELPKKGIVDTQLTMKAGGYAAVRVLDHAGNPVPEQKFMLMPQANAKAKPKTQQPRLLVPQVASVADISTGSSSGNKTGRTDATGRAIVGPLAPGKYFAVVLAGNRGGGMIYYGWYGARNNPTEIGPRVPVDIVARKTAEVELTRPKMASLAGNIRNANGPVSNARVTLAPKGQKGGEYSMAQMQKTRRGRTDSEGNFELEGLPPGEYQFTVTQQKSRLSYRDEIVIQGTSEHRHDMFLRVGQVRFRVLASDKLASGVKLPTAGIKLTLTPRRPNYDFYSPGPGTAAQTTDAEGIVTFRDVPPGEYSVRIRGKDWVQPKREWFAIEAGAELERSVATERAAKLRYAATTADGKRPDSFQISCQRAGDAKPKLHWVHGKTGTLGNLPPGKYEVKARRSGGPNPQKLQDWNQPQSVVLEAGKTTAIQLKLR